jgi:hypothetical protein
LNNFFKRPLYSELSIYQEERWNCPIGYDYLVQHTNRDTGEWDNAILKSRPSAYITSLDRALERMDATDLTCRIVKIGRYLAAGTMIIVAIEKAKIVK